MMLSKMVGWAVGLGVIFSAFFLPFWDLTTGPGLPFDSLYGAAKFTQGELTAISQMGLPAVTELAVLVLAASLLVAVSGAFGVYPKAGGILGVVGMLALTLGPVLIYPTASISSSDFGTGFWALWVLSVANLFVGLAGGRSTTAAALPPPTVTQPAQA
ncbi:MAG TPA: hypothetical protein VEB67_02625 [Nitrososphaerales archaeon]|nr:hypothetical protein [Nitrososphaerales archaeon]